jgi:hypothetical protein
MIHDLKCWPEHFQAVKSGIKPFELRKDDRDYDVGDILHLREFDPSTEQFTGEELEKTVTYILPLAMYGTGSLERYVIMGLAPRDWKPYTEPLPPYGETVWVTVMKPNGTSEAVAAHRDEYTNAWVRESRDGMSTGEVVGTVVAWRKYEPDPLEQTNQYDSLRAEGDVQSEDR